LSVVVHRKVYPDSADSSLEWLLKHSSKTPSSRKTSKCYRLIVVFIAELMLCPSAGVLWKVCCPSGSLSFMKFH